ncbi:MAG: carboxyltransferase domain-containing protein [Tomitella sp.]|nr:carboxyltransferase domain-containing protein [Tomitella sp.]
MRGSHSTTRLCPPAVNSRTRRRSRVAAGSVAIAGSQTAVYPRAMPGGWRIIGHAGVELFDPDNEKRPCLLLPGDRVRFVPVEQAR